MSLPIPTSTGGAPLDPKQLQALDAPLIALTQQCGGDLRRLMFAYFSFLHRRTDFYLVPHPDDVQPGQPASMGFKEGDAEKLLVAAFRQFPLRRIPKGKGVGRSQQQPQPKQPAPAKSATVPSKPTLPTTAAAPASTSTEKAPAVAKESSANETEKAVESPAATTGPMSGVKYNEEGLQIPVGNGGSTKTYKWTQTAEECSVLVGVPKGLRGKDLDITIATSNLTIKSKQPLAGEKSPRTFVEGKLSAKVRPDESTWSFEGGVVVVTLEKLQKALWKNVLEGDEQIDTELVDNRRRISEYDDATQAQIRKIIFDQEQYHKGGPTSDEILGEKKSIPPLPTGVEYIDKKKLDEEDKKKKAEGKS